MTPVTVVDTSKQPKMTSTGYIGQSPEQLLKDLKHRRDMLTPDLLEKERLRRVGRDGYGDVYIDLLSFQR